jgi:pimeloyl-ACP methyl ester carboxylesterase
MKLVFLHGSGESSITFYYQMRHFRNSKGLDLPGHPSAKPCTSIEAYVEWVRGFIMARRYKDVILCGHSMGGAIAQQFGLMYPEEIRGLILLGTGARLRVDPKYLKQAKEGEKDLGKWLDIRRSTFDRVPQDVHDMLMRKGEEVGPAVQHNDLMCCDRFDIMEKVQQISLPTAIICGSEDVMTPVKYSNYLKEKISGSSQTVINGASHFAQVEKPYEVNKAIEDFVAGLA